MPRSPELETCGVAAGGMTAAGAAERIVANLVLCIIYCQLRDDELAKAHIFWARAAVQTMPAHPNTIRPARQMKLVCFHIEVAGSVETTILPIVAGVMLRPEIRPHQSVIWSEVLSSGCREARLRDIEINYYRMRLRTGRLRSALIRVTQTDSLEQLETSARDILGQCVYHDVPLVAHLDVANDYLALASEFTRQCNFAIAGLALSKADSALHCYSESASAMEARIQIQGMSAQIAKLTGSLTSIVS